MAGFLLLGFLIGMQHALEADHLAAVGTMIEGRGSRWALVFRGAVWGLGHTITLFLICAAVILAGLQLTEQLGSALEFCVGVMLLVLGLDVLRRIRSKRVHIHLHSHGDSGTHIHAHNHEPAQHPHQHDADPHDHQHRERFPKKALLIGLLHGGAGSAGLLALAAAATQSPAIALAYVLLFGTGAMVGMAALTFIVAWPLSRIESSAVWIHQGILYAAAGCAIFLGLSIMSGNIGWLGVLHSA